MKVLVAVRADKGIVLEIRQDDDKPIAHAVFDVDGARGVAQQLNTCADIAAASGGPDKRRFL